jgi:hypothetical protein
MTATGKLEPPARPARTGPRPGPRYWPAAGWLLLAFVAGILTVYFAFQTGAYFPGPTAVGTLALIVLLIGRVLLAERPFAGLSVPLGVAAGALTLLAGWILLSAVWSDSPARAMTEFDRALLYLLALVFFGSFPRDPRMARWLLWGLALSMTALCTAALITRTVPDFWSAPAALQRNRLNYPIGYWNALGVVASLALVFCMHRAGALTGDKSLKNEGKGDQAAGSVKHGVDKVKDAVTGKDR